MKKTLTIILLSLLGILCFAQSPNSQYVFQKFPDDTTIIIGNDTVLISSKDRDMAQMFILNLFDTMSAPCNNAMAIKIFEQRIERLKQEMESHIRCSEGDLLIENFAFLTNINPEKGGDYFGFMLPTHNDIAKWEQWLQEHKDRLCWYEQKDILFLKKEGGKMF